MLRGPHCCRTSWRIKPFLFFPGISHFFCLKEFDNNGVEETHSRITSQLWGGSEGYRSQRSVIIRGDWADRPIPAGTKKWRLAVWTTSSDWHWQSFGGNKSLMRCWCPSVTEPTSNFANITPIGHCFPSPHFYYKVNANKELSDKGKYNNNKELLH